MLHVGQYLADGTAPWVASNLPDVGKNGMNNDNWGFRARFGIFIVGADPVPEPEWQAMAPRGVSIHAARVSAPSPWAAWQADHQGVDLADDLAKGCTQFSDMRISAVTIAHTTSGVVGGQGWDAAVVAKMRTILGDTVAATTSGADTNAALNAMGVRQPFLVMPPWFGEDLISAASQYLADNGYGPVGHMRYEPGGKWSGIPPQDVYAQGIGIDQDIDLLYQQIVANCLPDADAVVIGGTGFRCVGIIEALETALGRPVITANQASLWRCLRLSGIDDTVQGYGKLLSLSLG